jgi:hypothetical protein
MPGSLKHITRMQAVLRHSSSSGKASWSAKSKLAGITVVKIAGIPVLSRKEEEE